MTKAAAGLLLLVYLAGFACDTESRTTPTLGRTDTGEQELRLSRVRAPSIRGLTGLDPDARFVKNTTTGSYRIYPRSGAVAGQRLKLEGGEGACRASASIAAESVIVVLSRVQVVPGQHDPKMTWILTRVFEVDPSGWSGTIRLPKSPEVAEYAVGAMCELGGHAYYPSSYSVYVGKRSG